MTLDDFLVRQFGQLHSPPPGYDRLDQSPVGPLTGGGVTTQVARGSASIESARKLPEK